LIDAGEAIDIWQVERPLGAGGMGSVYRCHNRDAPRILAAIKVLEPSTARATESRARFVREAEILFGLDHPNIVRVRNVRLDHDPPYLEMEFIEGESLVERLRRGSTAEDVVLPWFEQLMSALDYLHERGVFHRDIKPANLLINSAGVLRLVDFGLATEKNLDPITEAGVNFGTVAYAPPEWATPEQLQPMTWDLYASGVVFYELLTGKLAFRAKGNNPRQQAIQVMLQKQSLPPLDIGHGFNSALRQLILALTDPDPLKRPASARVVLDQLGPLLRPTTYAPSPPSASSPDIVLPPPSHGWRQPQRASSKNHSKPAGETTATPLPNLEDFLDLHGDGDHRPARTEAPTEWSDEGPDRAAILGVALILASAATGAMLWFNRPAEAPPPAFRDLIVAVAGAAPAQITVNGQLPVGKPENGRYRFDQVQVGAPRIVIVDGVGCGLNRCPGPDCAPSCVIFETSRVLPDDNGTAEVTISRP
jgi:serine/threonine protein kinase